MHDYKENLKTRLKLIENYDVPDWSRLPDIDLYMDQVLTYLDKHLRQLYDYEENKIMTSSMINNYVKAKIIESPEGKKYGKEQISRLFAMAMLKRVLPINDIKTLIDDLSDNKVDQHDYFTSKQQSILVKTAEATSQQLNKIKHPDTWREDYAKLALDLVLEAHANSLVAEHLLKAIKTSKEQEQEALEQIKKKEKEKKDDKKQKDTKNAEDHKA